ncbi:hypothetical protein DV515_00007487, partial [Chloebia gouldiae]
GWEVAMCSVSALDFKERSWKAWDVHIISFLRDLPFLKWIQLSLPMEWSFPDLSGAVPIEARCGAFFPPGWRRGWFQKISSFTNEELEDLIPLVGAWKDKRDNVLVLPLEVTPGHVAVGLVPGGICRYPVTGCTHLLP